MKSNKWKIFTILVCSCMLFMQIGFIINNLWIADFWEHAAVLRELILHPFNPTNPILKVNVPHAFFSPYMVTLGIIGHYLELSNLTLLNIVSIFNLALFLYSFFLLSKLFLDQSNPYKSFIFLLFTHLFFWGFDAWGWSGFFHFGSLSFGLPYPSTFSFCLSIISAYLYEKFIKVKQITLNKIFLFIAVIGLNWIVILTHPVTFVFTFTLFFFIQLRKTNILNIEFKRWLAPSNFIALFSVVVVMILPLLLTRFWLYYPFLNLFSSAVPDNRFHLDSQILYSMPYVRVFPVSIIFVLIYLEGRKFILDNLNLLLILIILLLVYLYGFFSKHYGYGRCLSYLVLYFHILLVPYLTSMWFNRKNKKWFYPIFILFSIPYAFINLLPIIHRSIPYIPQTEVKGRRVKFIENHLQYNEVVLSDEETSCFIPAFRGRVIASHYPPYWINDNKQRLKDMNIFFQDSTLSIENRKSILDKYYVDYILLSPKYASLKRKIDVFIDTSHHQIESDNYILLKVKLN
jgi:hypothetical protein